MRTMVTCDFTPATTYDASDLNMVLGCFVEGGVAGMNDLKVAYKDGKATITGGRCILPDKSLMTVDQEGYTVPTDIYDGYIYIAGGEIGWGELPGSGNILLLAQITEGKCTDLRKRAQIYTGEGVN